MKHKWENKGRRHVKVCVKCGCVKDSTIMNIARYEIDDETHFQAPECDERLLSKKQ